MIVAVKKPSPITFDPQKPPTVSAFQKLSEKILTAPQLRHTADRWRTDHQRIVFTNGCFDLLHYGHLHYLAAAADLGDKLVIGLNSANSVRRLKGPTRPINDEPTRQHTLAALGFVDAVCVFEEDTPLKLITLLKPDVLVKGGDYRAEDVVGARELQSWGGEVKILPFVEGYSTTNVEAKILGQRR